MTERPALKRVNVRLFPRHVAWLRRRALDEVEGNGGRIDPSRFLRSLLDAMIARERRRKR